MVSSSSESCELQRPAQEPRVRSSRGLVEHLRRAALLDDPALVHEDDAVADLAGELHLVRDDEHRHPLAREVAHDDEHLADELRVERRRDLVEEHHVRLHHQRARDRDPLLLAARELVRVLVGLLLEPDAARAARAPRRSASARGILRIRRAASVRLSITVRCGKRLNCWKTIPIRWRTAETSAPLRGDLLALEEDPARLDAARAG